MKLYIDTNTYISYISLTSDIKSLEKLKKLIIDKKVELILPSQTKKEYLKHFKDRIYQARKKLKEPITPIALPNELKSKKKEKYTKEEKEISEKIEDINDKLRNLISKRSIELQKHLENVGRLIKDIFNLSIIIEDNDEIVLKAVVRQVKGLPPKKDNFKFGDAIIWETLKAYIGTESIAIVSSDPDFSEPNKTGKPAKINKILKTEWKKHTKKEITLYSLLGYFVNKIEKENPINSETIKKEAVQTTNYGYSPIIFRNEDLKNSNILNGQLINTDFGKIESITIPINNGGVFVSDHNAISTFGSASTLGAFDGKSIYSTLGLNVNNSILGGTQTESGISSLKQTNICNRCGKTYTYSITSIYIPSLCNDCLKYFSL